MSKKMPFPTDDDSSDLVKRFEKYLAHEASGYFDVDELERIVDYYLRKGKTSEGSQAVEHGLLLHPNNYSLKAKRAKIFLAAADPLKAFKILEPLASSNDYEISLLRIETFCRLSRLKEAQFICNQILEQEHDDIDNICMDFSLIFLSVLEAETALHYLIIGDEFNPKNTDLLFDLAFCYESTQQVVKALATYTRLIQLNPYSAEAWFNSGQIYFNKQEYGKALMAYDYAHVIQPDDMLTVLQKAHSHFQLQEFVDAIEYYKIYEESASEKWQSSLYIAESYERLEDFTHALEYYTRSLEEFADNFDALTGITICLLELEKYEESIEFAKRSIEMNEEAADAWVYLAEGLTGTDNTEAAYLAYLKSISIDPEQPDTLMAIGNITMEKGEYQMALNYYKEALSLNMDAELENIDLFMAVAYFKLDDMVNSEICLARALAKNLDARELFDELCPDNHFENL